MTKEKIIQGLYRGDSRAIKEAIKTLEQEPCEDAISRKAVKELFQEGSVMGMYYFLGIDELPSVTPAPKKSKWIFTKTTLDKYGCTVECPSCHKKWTTYDEIRFEKETRYCPNCGEKMESEE